MSRLVSRVLLVLLATLGCAPGAGAGLGATCASASECSAPLVCRLGACRVQCVDNRDCGAGASCLRVGTAGACSLASDLGCETGVGRACPSGLVCVADRCTNTCTTSMDCPSDGSCSTSGGVSFCSDPGSGDAGPDPDASTLDAFDPCFGRMDCDTDPSDCETDVYGDPLHCGTCTRRCPDRANAQPACTMGQCGLACDGLFLDCDHDPVTGCEIDGAVDPASCGTCHHACTTDPICARGDCYPLPFPSTGLDGDFHATMDQALPARRYDYLSFTIDAGVTVTTDGDGELDIRVSGAVMIAGTLDVSGASGGALGNGTCVSGGANAGGGATARVGGIGAASNNGAVCRDGGDGGSGANGTTPSTGALACGMGGAFGGGAGGGRQFAGGGGGGYAGGGGGANIGTPAARSGGDGASAPGRGTGGLGGVGPDHMGGRGGEPSLGAPLAGGDATAMPTCGPGGGGGGSIGAAAAADLAMTTTFYAGSGGGGGAGYDCSGGGGGGGGGGAVRIASATTITITASGAVRADGGAGSGVPSGTANRGGGGGGGSGGAVFFSSPVLVVDGAVSARGGAAGSAACGGSRGAAGGLGRVRISALSDRCMLGGMWSHAFTDACNPAPGAAGSVFIDAYPF